MLPDAAICVSRLRTSNRNFQTTVEPWKTDQQRVHKPRNTVRGVFDRLRHGAENLVRKSLPLTDLCSVGAIFYKLVANIVSADLLETGFLKSTWHCKVCIQ